MFRGRRGGGRILSSLSVLFLAAQAKHHVGGCVSLGSALRRVGLNADARLEAVARLVRQAGAKGVIDVGCDHGLLSIGLSLLGTHRVIGCDLNQRPLLGAMGNVRQVERLQRRSLDGLEFRLGPGLSCLAPSEVSCVAMAGLGVNTMKEILDSHDARALGVDTLVLQPVSSRAQHLAEVRDWFRQGRWRIESEVLISAGGRHYVTFLAHTADGMDEEGLSGMKTQQQLLLGDFLLPSLLHDGAREEVLCYWEHQRAWLQAILASNPLAHSVAEDLRAIESIMTIQSDGGGDDSHSDSNQRQ